MKRKELIPLLEQARAGGYAVPHFNFATFFELLAILEAAAEEKAPVFVASLPMVAEMYDPAVLSLAVEKLCQRTGAKAILHLDHSTDPALCKRAADAGYGSVMIDASRLTLAENIAAVRAVATHAHGLDCAVEGEIGRIKGRGDEGSFDGGDFLVEVADAAALAETGLDLMAIGIGTAHGFYKGKPNINFERLAEVAKAVQTPLVLHGGTGIPAEDVGACIRGGIVKVNVGTIIRHTYLTATAEEIASRGAATPPVELAVPAVTDRVKEVARAWIRTCRADGKA